MGAAHARARSRLRLALVAVAALIAAALALPAGASAQAQIPCSGDIGGGKYNCTFYPAGDGISGGSPVLDSAGTRVGFLRKGVNWVVCQQAGRRETSGPYFNKWWAYTLSDGNRWGWVNGVHASGGDNDGSFANVPNCNGTKGNPPGGGAAPPPPPPAPSGDRAAAADRAVAWAESKIGTRQCTGEQPAWNRGFGFNCTIAWCGVFAYTALTQGGFALNKARMAYTENIYTDALSGANGLTVIPKHQAQRGDLILFYWGGAGRRVQHVGLVRGPVVNGQISTVEGNTDSPSRVGTHTMSINWSKIKAIVRVGNVRASGSGLRPYAAKDPQLRRKRNRRYGLKKGEKPIDYGFGQKAPKKKKPRR